MHRRLVNQTYKKHHKKSFLALAKYLMLWLSFCLCTEDQLNDVPSASMLRQGHGMNYFTSQLL